MSLTELMPKSKPSGMLAKVVERMPMHGVDAAREDLAPAKKKTAAANPNEGLFIFLGKDGKVLGVGGAGDAGKFSQFGTVLRKVTAPANMDLDNLPDSFNPLSVLGRG